MSSSTLSVVARIRPFPCNTHLTALSVAESLRATAFATKSEIPEFKSGKMCPFCEEIKYENVERHISGHIFGTIKAGKNLEPKNLAQ